MYPHSDGRRLSQDIGCERFECGWQGSVWSVPSPWQTAECQRCFTQAGIVYMCNEQFWYIVWTVEKRRKGIPSAFCTQTGSNAGWIKIDLCLHGVTFAKGSDQSCYTRAGPTKAPCRLWSLPTPPFLNLKWWCILALLPLFAAVKNDNELQTSLFCISSNADSCQLNISVSTQILKPIKFCW